MRQKDYIILLTSTGCLSYKLWTADHFINIAEGIVKIRTAVFRVWLGALCKREMLNIIFSYSFVKWWQIANWQPNEVQSLKPISVQVSQMNATKHCLCQGPWTKSMTITIQAALDKNEVDGEGPVLSPLNFEPDLPFKSKKRICSLLQWLVWFDHCNAKNVSQRRLLSRHGRNYVSNLWLKCLLQDQGMRWQKCILKLKVARAEIIIDQANSWFLSDFVKDFYFELNWMPKDNNHLCFFQNHDFPFL